MWRAVVRARDVVDPDHLARQRDDERGVSEELEGGGRSRPSTREVRLPSFSTRSSRPVFGDAGRPSFSGMTGRSQTPCDRAYSP
jgi:hypothetical protein